MKTIPIRSILDKGALVAFTLLNAISSEAIAQSAIASPIAKWSYIHHSSTELEGALREQAGVSSAFATYRYLDSLAAVNYREAYRRDQNPVSGLAQGNHTEISAE